MGLYKVLNEYLSSGSSGIWSDKTDKIKKKPL